VNTAELDDKMLSYLIEMKYIVEVLNKPISLRILTDKIDQIMITTIIKEGAIYLIIHLLP
jgi:hypothetical protein